MIDGEGSTVDLCCDHVSFSSSREHHDFLSLTSERAFLAPLEENVQGGIGEERERERDPPEKGRNERGKERKKGGRG